MSKEYPIKEGKEVIGMKKILMLSLAIGMVLAIGSKAFAMLEKPPIIDKNLSLKYQITKPLF